jgi:hypothetical protein
MQEPSLCAERTEIVLPHSTCSNMEQDDPIKTRPKTDKPEDNDANALTLMPLPVQANSLALADFPHLTCVLMDRVEPSKN